MTLGAMSDLQEWPEVDEHHPGAKGTMEDRICSKCEHFTPNKTQMAHHQRLWHK